MFKRLCNRNLKSCKQFTAINIHSLHAVEFGSVTTFEQMKKNLEKKKVIVDVQGVSNTAKQRRLTRLLVLFRRHTRDKNRRVQNYLPVKKKSNRSSSLTKQRRRTRTKLCLLPLQNETVNI